MNEEEYRLHNYVPEGVRVIPDFFDDLERVLDYLNPELFRYNSSLIRDVPEFIKKSFREKIGVEGFRHRAQRYLPGVSFAAHKPHLDGNSSTLHTVVITLLGGAGPKFFKNSQGLPYASCSDIRMRVSDAVPFWNPEDQNNLAVCFPENYIHCAPLLEKDVRLIYGAAYRAKQSNHA